MAQARSDEEKEILLSEEDLINAKQFLNAHKTKMAVDGAVLRKKMEDNKIDLPKTWTLSESVYIANITLSPTDKDKVNIKYRTDYVPKSKRSIAKFAAQSVGSIFDSPETLDRCVIKKISELYKREKRELEEKQKAAARENNDNIPGAGGP